MADIVSMDYSAMGNLANEVTAMNREFQDMITNLATLVDSLDGQWQGKAQVEFAAAYSKLKPKLDTISEVLQNYATEINNVVIREQDMESLNKSLFNPVNYPSF
jgi:WXG100 family type VII secretion target